MNDWFDAEEHVERAHELYDAGRWDEAESELRQALSLNPYQPEWYFNLGLTLEAAGRHKDAADAFAKCSDLNDESGQPDPNAVLLTGANLIRAGKPEDALPWLDTAEKLEPMNVAVVVHRIEAFTDLKRFDDAEEAFYLGQQADPEYPELYLAMGEALDGAGQHERAVWCFREAARLDPALPRVRAHLASAYAKVGRSERARQLYLQELRVDPGDTDTLLDLGDLLLDMQRPQEAAEKYRRVLELDPSSADAHHALADLALSSGDPAEALIHYDVVLRIDKTYPAVRTRLASALLDRGRDEDTPRIRDLLKQEFQALGKPDAPEPDPEELESLAETLVIASMPELASRVYERLIETDTPAHRVWHGLSVSQLEAGRVEEGISSAKRSLEYRPTFVPAMHNLVLAYYRQGQHIRATYWLRQAMRLDADDPSLRRLRMRLRIRRALGVWGWCARRARKALGLVLAPLVRPVR